MKTYNIIPIGTKVIANSKFKGIIISISIRKNSITYEVQKTTDTGIITYWFNDWEITSKHTKDLAIASLIKAEYEEEN